VGEIYFLYSTEDGKPRYVGRSERSGARRYREHVARALDLESGKLCDWIRSAWDSGYEVEFYVIQTAIIPADLELFEQYWIGQFAGLLNDPAGKRPCAMSSSIGEQVIRAVQSMLSSRLQVPQLTND
jgi:hypothetical protein